MMYRKVPNTVLNRKPNLTNALMPNSTIKNNFFRYSFTLREVAINNVFKRLFEAKNKMKMCIGNGILLRALQNTLQSIPSTLKNQSTNVLRVWAHQCECVFAQRLRRSQQMFCLYTKLWEERALKEFLSKMRNQMTRHGKELMFSAVGVTAYNWNANMISDQDMAKHLNELAYIRVLTEKTFTCESCILGQTDVANLTNLTYCKCLNRAIFKPRSYDDWVPFIEKKDMLVWRRLHKSGAYEYKVYGSFNDVTAEDFLNVQIDCDYRKTWDTTAVSLEVVEHDESTNSNSDVIYWEMLWPKLFTNRDYVFNRRFKIDGKSKKVVIMSRATEHKACPAKSDKFRIKDYWSVMVIQPYSQLNKPGIEFGLTYYDNPGVNIPSAVTTWVAMRAMPDFLVNLRAASKEYKAYCKRMHKNCIYNFKPSSDAEESQSGDDDEDDIIFDNTVFEPEYSIARIHKSHAKLVSHHRKIIDEKPPPDAPKEVSNKQQSNNQEVLTSSSIVQAESDHRYWKYLHPNYYFS